MNLNRIEAILRLLQGQMHVGEIAVEGEDWRLMARRAPGMGFLPSAVTEEPEEPAALDQRIVVRSTRVGVYRLPDRPLQPGDWVNRGDRIGNIDSMHILNPIVAEQPGRVVEVLVEDGDPVEYGQELFVLLPDSLAEAETG